MAYQQFYRFPYILFYAALFSNINFCNIVFSFPFKHRAAFYGGFLPTRELQMQRSDIESDSYCDVAIIGGGIGGLSAAAILSSTYKLRVHVYEGHYHAGGCAHAFNISSKDNVRKYMFDAGPTILLGCSRAPFNPLQQVLNHLGAQNSIKWIPYNAWGMYTPETGPWRFELGENRFETGPLVRFGGTQAVEEFRQLRAACAPLCAGAVEIPTMALRGDSWRMLPLLQHWSALQKVIPYTSVLDGSFAPLIEKYVSKNSWLRSWLDALAFSLSGLPAAETSTAALAYTLFDLHREGAALDYPVGGMGTIADVLVKVIEETGSRVFLHEPVAQIVLDESSSQPRAVGLRLKKENRFIRAKQGVICNANIWALPDLISQPDQQKLTSTAQQFLSQARATTTTKSFLHLHLGLNAEGLDLNSKEAHYTVMMKGLSGKDVDVCSDRNMVAVSNPCQLDRSLVQDPTGKHIAVHAYGAGNEPFELWEGEDRYSAAYKQKKEKAADYLRDATCRALQIDRKELQERTDVSLVGTPLTHARYLRRHRGSYGAAWKDCLDGPVTPIDGLFLAGDSVFPGIGVPAVAVSGASAANSMVNVLQHVFEITRRQ